MCEQKCKRVRKSENPLVPRIMAVTFSCLYRMAASKMVSSSFEGK